MCIHIIICKYIYIYREREREREIHIDIYIYIYRTQYRIVGTVRSTVPDPSSTLRTWKWSPTPQNIIHMNNDMNININIDINMNIGIHIIINMNNLFGGGGPLPGP